METKIVGIHTINIPPCSPHTKESKGTLIPNSVIEWTIKLNISPKDDRKIKGYNKKFIRWIILNKN